MLGFRSLRMCLPMPTTAPAPPAKMVTSRLGTRAILMIGLILAFLQEAYAQVDSLPLRVSIGVNPREFRIDLEVVNSLVRTIDSIQARGGSSECSFSHNRVPCSVLTKPPLRTPPENFVLFHPPYNELGRGGGVSLTPGEFGYDTVTPSRFRLNKQWIPARLTVAGNDSIRTWLSEIEVTQPVCDADDYCPALLFQAWNSDTLRFTAISQCSLIHVVPISCRPLAISDGREWWIEGIIGHILFREPPISDTLWLAYVVRPPYDIEIQGRVELASILTAVARGLSALPRPGLETAQRRGFVLGSANRRMSPVLRPYREIVDIIVTVEQDPEGYGLWIRPHILVNRYNDSDDRSYHLPSSADSERYMNVVRAMLRRSLSSVCYRPFWSSQILTCR